MSKVWDHFALNEEDKSKAICGLCNIKIVRGLGKKSSTSSLWKHLKYKHPLSLVDEDKEETQPSNSSGNIK